MTEPTPDDRIDAYLDRLLAALAGRPADVRRVLAETEAHLLEAVDEGVAAGLGPDAAVDAALARFGSPAAMARRYRRTSVPMPVLRELVAAGSLLLAIGLVAIGVSGVASMGLRAAFGSRFVAGDLPGVTYTPARCADFESFHPEAGSCDSAAAGHHADEVEQYRVAAGVLGLLVLGGRWAVLRRRDDDTSTIGVLPDGMVAATGAATFGLAGVALVVEALNSVAQGAQGGSWLQHGAGQWVTAAVVSLAVAAAFAVQVARSLAARTPVGPAS